MLVDPPSGNPVIGYMTLPPVFYKDDNIEMTCSVSGGLPPANLSLDCPGLTSNSQTGNSSHTCLTASGTATKALNGKTCTCTAQHYAWLILGSNQRTVQTPNITVYCEFNICLEKTSEQGKIMFTFLYSVLIYKLKLILHVQGMNQFKPKGLFLSLCPVNLTLLLLDPPGPASVNLNPAVWLENRTYSVSCMAAPGNPQNQYTMTLNGQQVHAVSEYIIAAHKDQDKAVLACNVSNKFTVDRNVPVYDTKQLVVHCKF